MEPQSGVEKSARKQADHELAELIPKIMGGDQSALVSLYEQTGSRVFAHALRFASDHDTAEEVLLDVYTQVWKNAAGYDPNRASVLAWLSGIAGVRAAERISEARAEAEPPDYLRDLLSARIERESQEKPQPPPAGVPKAGIDSRTAAARTPVFAQPPQERSRFPWLLVVAFALAAGIGFFAWKQSDDAAKGLSESLSRAQADVTNLRALIEAQRARSAELDQINALIAAQGVRVIHLLGQAASPASSAVLFWDVEKRQCLVVGSFPDPPEGKVYQLWLTAGQASMGSGVLHTDPLGHVFTTIGITQDPSKVTGAEVSLEPESGSTQPTPPLIAVGSGR